MKRSIALLAILLFSPSLWAGESGGSSEASVSASSDNDLSSKDSKYPLQASVSLGYGFNHANFASTDSDSLSYGWQLLTFSGNVGYSFTKDISASLGFAVDKALSEGYYRAPVAGGASSRTLKQTELRDLNLGAAWNFLTLRGANLNFTGGFDVAIPTSKASQAAGLILSLSPSLTMSWAAAGFSASASIAYAYNINQDPTAQIDCERFPDLCRIHGEDVGQPNALHSLSGNVTVGYAILDNLNVHFSYGLSNGYDAVKFPEDEFSSPYAQNGTQAGLGMHSTSLGLSWKFLEKTSLGLRMSTVRSLHTSDGKDITQPFFDTDSDISHRTSYGVTLTQTL